MKVLNIIRNNVLSHKVIISFIIFFGLFFFATFSYVSAQQPVGTLDLGLQFVSDSGLTTRDIRVVVARIIRISFGLLGMVAVAIVLYGGFIWMTSRGESGKIDEAKKIIINGAIGLAIILSAFGITEFILRSILGGAYSGGGSSTNNSSSQQQVNTFGGGALGRSIRSHHPDRDALDVARNTKIVVTFVEKIKDETIYDPLKKGGVNINAQNVKIYKSSDAKIGGVPPADALLIKDVTVATVDSLTYVFSLSNYLGSPSEKVSYIVYLGSGIQTLQGQSIFGTATGSYLWQFTTSTSLDLTPPYVDRVTPINSQNCPNTISDCSPRNEVIQIHFNEAIDPTTVSGIAPTFPFIQMTPQIKGEFLVSNQYRTVTFLSQQPCDNLTKNSCGDPIYCLPSSAKFEVTLRAARLDSAQQGTSQASVPYTGIVDLSGNSLDGQGGLKIQPPVRPDGKSDGSPKDDYVWNFNTSDNIDLTPPHIIMVKPDVNTSKVPLNTPVQVEFSKDILGDTLFDGIKFFYGLSIKLAQRDPWDGASSVAFISTVAGGVNPRIVIWNHYDPLLASTAQKTYYFYPTVYSSLKDTRQNCFNPAAGPVQTILGLRCDELKQDAWKNSTVGVHPDCDLTK